MELSDENFHTTYESKLKSIIQVIVAVHIILLAFRFVIRTEFSLIQTLGLIQLVLLIFILIRDKCKLEAKVFIIFIFRPTFS